MRVVSIEDCIANSSGVRDELIRDLKNGACMIYPTDTVYGIGTIDDERYTRTVGAFKERDMDLIPYSIIAPSLNWIDTTYPRDQSSASVWKSISSRYPGRGLTCIYDADQSGVRYLNDHPIQNLIQSVGLPFVTTSANLTGHPTITSIDALRAYPESKKALIDRAIDGGVLDGPGSVIIDTTTGAILRE